MTKNTVLQNIFILHSTKEKHTGLEQNEGDKIFTFLGERSFKIHVA